MKTRQYKAGDIIIAEGTFGEQTFLITEGEVLICKETGTGRIPIAVLQTGEVFGEMALLDSTGFRSATVVAKTDVSVEITMRDEMEKYLAETPPIVLSMMKTLSSRLAVASQEITVMKFQNRNWFMRKLGQALFPKSSF